MFPCTVKFEAEIRLGNELNAYLLELQSRRHSVITLTDNQCAYLDMSLSSAIGSELCIPFGTPWWSYNLLQMQRKQIHTKSL